MDLFPHNQQIFDKYKEMKDTHKNTLVIQGTGLGKTIITIKIIDTYFSDKPVLYVVPKKALKNEVKRNKHWNFKNVEFICYHSLKKYNPKYYSLCIFDEVHRSGAPKWIKHAKRFIDYETCNVLGLTATEVRMDGLDISKSVFTENDTIKGLSIFEAMKLGILPKPKYVCALLHPEKVLSEIEKSLEYTYDKYEKEYILRKIKSIKNDKYNEFKIENIIEKHSNGSNKYIVFVPKIKDCYKWAERFKNILNTDEIYCIHSKNDSSYNDRIINYFNNYKGTKNIALLGVDILSEGLHIDGVSQIIMLRGTKSAPTYMQMIGRVLCCTDKDVTPVIFDFAENYKNYAIYEHERKCNTKRNKRKMLKVETEEDILCDENKQKECFTITKDYIYDFNNIAKNLNIIWTDEMLENLSKMSFANFEKVYGIHRIAAANKAKELKLRPRKNILVENLVDAIKYNAKMRE